MEIIYGERTGQKNNCTCQTRNVQFLIQTWAFKSKQCCEECQERIEHWKEERFKLG